MNNRNKALLGAAALAMGLLSALSVPLRYDHANSGRYLLPVLQAANPALFPDDPVVDSLTRFRSLFYDSLVFVARHTQLDPEGLETLYSWLYLASRILIVLALMRIARSLDTDPITTLLIGTWGCFTSSVPVGGESLFVNVVTHGTLSLLLGAAALWWLLDGRRLGFWLLLTVNLFVHPLMALHLGLCLTPAYLLLCRRIDRKDVAGGGVFLAGLLVCLGTVPPFSPDEAALLVAAKGGINHVDLAAQGLSSWVRQIAVLMVALGVWLAGRVRSPSSRLDLLALGVVSGTLGACLLSLATQFVDSARLVQLQPLRTFVWVQLLCYLLIAVAAVRAWRERAPSGPPLLLFFSLSLVPTLWQLPAALLVVAAVCLPQAGRLWTAATWGVASLSLAGWLMRDLWPAAETLRNPAVVALALSTIVLWCPWSASESHRRRWALLALAIFCASAAVSWHRYYDERTYADWGPSFRDRMHLDWDAIRRWVAKETDQDHRVLVAGGQGNFRTLALRSAIGERMSALAWVDPHLNLRFNELADRVERCLGEDGWDLACLARTAKSEGAHYVLVEGDVADTPPATRSQPLVRQGIYRVYSTSELDGEATS